MKGPSPLIIGIVGPCGSGKSTLQRALKKLGYRAHHIAQEHSFVQDMWKKVTNPDILIYLNASYETVIKRKKFNFSQREYAEEKRRLSHAYEHADLIINTDPLSPHEVFQKALQFIQNASE